MKVYETMHSLFKDSNSSPSKYKEAALPQPHPHFSLRKNHFGLFWKILSCYFLIFQFQVYLIFRLKFPTVVHEYWVLLHIRVHILFAHDSLSHTHTHTYSLTHIPHSHTLSSPFSLFLPIYYIVVFIETIS